MTDWSFWGFKGDIVVLRILVLLRNLIAFLIF